MSQLPSFSQSQRTCKAEVASSLSVQPEASTWKVVSTVPEVGETVKDAVGAVFWLVTVICLVVVFVKPPVSFTSNFIVFVPVVLY